MLINSVPLGIHGLLVQLENGLRPCPQEHPVSVNLNVGLYLCRASWQTCSRLASPAKTHGLRNERAFQNAVGTMPVSVAGAAGEDNPSENEQWTGHG